MAYVPTSDEFPGPGGAAAKLASGVYDGRRDVLYFAKMPGNLTCNTHRVQEIIVHDGLISCTVLQPPYGDRRAWTDMRSLEGEYTCTMDSAFGNFNVSVHPNVARLVIKANASPRTLQQADIRMIEALRERLASESKSESKFEEAKDAGDEKDFK